jgi:hypothetical protein
MVVIAAVVGGVLGALGTVLTWYTIAIGGVVGHGGSATGLDGRDGRTVLAAAVIAVVAAVLVALGRRRVAAKVALLAAGTVTVVVAVAAIVDATGKDDEVADRFGIPADRVAAQIGVGLWLVAAAGVVLAVAGAALQNTADDGSDNPRP